MEKGFSFERVSSFAQKAMVFTLGTKNKGYRPKYIGVKI
jgi:hypothetical protein